METAPARTWMPIFLDSHHGAELPLDVIRDFLRGAKSGLRDGFGITPLDLYCGEDGRVFCVLAAPDEAAIRQRHAVVGVVCGRIRRVQSVRPRSDELSAEQKAIVRQMILSEHSSTAGALESAGRGEPLHHAG